MDLTRSATFRPLLLAGAIAALAGCGSDSDSSPAAGAPTGSASGILTDSPIAGVNYATSSGVRGVTDADGRYKYNPGDTVTFRIGSFELGTVTATGTVTPLELVQTLSFDAATKQNIVTNLLVLLQSLDENGDASDGIRIPASVGAALTSAVANSLSAALQLSPAAFADTSTNTAFAAAVQAAGPNAEVQNPETALGHFREQFLKALAGVYYVTQDDTTIVFRFNSDGSYLMGEVGPDDYDEGVRIGTSGLERGQINWDPLTGEVTATVTLDTNMQRGLSNPFEGEKVYFSMNGTSLVARAVDSATGNLVESHELPRLGSNGVVGPWVLNQVANATTSLGVQQIILLPNGKYFMVDPVGDDDEPSCGGAGVEFGSYTFTSGASAGQGTLTFSNIEYDTNGCAGLHDQGTFTSLSITLNSDGTMSVVADDDEAFTMARPLTQLPPVTLPPPIFPIFPIFPPILP